jgi:hypothetical protein
VAWRARPADRQLFALESGYGEVGKPTGDGLQQVLKNWANSWMSWQHKSRHYPGEKKTLGSLGPQ